MPDLATQLPKPIGSDLRRSRKRHLFGTAALLVGLLLPSAAAALGLNCDIIDRFIKDSVDKANAEFRTANQYASAANAGPGLWGTLTSIAGIWNPVPSSASDAAESACRGGLAHVVGGIAMTNKAIQTADALGQSQGQGVNEAQARFARERGRKHMAKARSLLQWKKKNCGCERTGRIPGVHNPNNRGAGNSTTGQPRPGQPGGRPK